MRKKTKGRKLKPNSSQNKGKLTDQSTESTVESEVQVQAQKSSGAGGEDLIKDENEHVIAVIDKSPAKGKTSEESNTEVDDDGDDAPEDVSWKSSKESAIRERTLEKEIALDAKRKEKQTRIERNERLREQKERKRAREYSRLPMEVLQEVAKRQKSQNNEDVLSQSVDTGNHVTFDSSSEDDQDEKEEGPEVNDETPEIKVLVLPREVKKPKKIQQSASLFLREQLFGDRIQRISPSKDSDRTRKYKTIAPALKFSKKSCRQGKLRLQKWYTASSQKEKKKITRDLITTVLARKPKMCSFLEYKDMKVVYKRYASLYFCVAIEKDDNELLTLEIIHRYVELLDKYFGSVCELDIIFNFEKAYFMLDELILGGEIQETSKKNVLKAISAQDLLQEEGELQRTLEEMGLA
ncbi:hypothetical protein ACROYT_G027042 [Oculina patagonica]